MTNEERIQLTKSNLIEATIKLMKQLDNPIEVTSREIAREANCKPAMINYCFGSREELIYSVFQRIYKGYQQSPEFLTILHEELTPKELLKKTYYYGAKALTENYKFARAIGGFVLLKRDLTEESFSYKYVYAHYKGTKTEDECKFIAYELSAMMQLVVYRMEDIKENFGMDLSKDDELRRLINLRVDLLLGDVK